MRPKVFPTIEKLIETAVKVGHNRQDATGVIAKSYEYIKRTYPNATAKKAVHIAYVIY